MRPGLTEAAFREYEGVIAAITNAYPKQFRLQCPTEKSPATFVARLRDAIASHKENHWSSTIIDWLKFDSSFHKNRDGVEIAEVEGVGIVARPRGQKTEKKQMEVVQQKDQVFEINDQTLADDQVQVVCRLASIGALKGPVKVQMENPSEIEHFEESWDVVIEQLQSEGLVTIS